MTSASPPANDTDVGMKGVVEGRHYMGILNMLGCLRSMAVGGRRPQGGSGEKPASTKMRRANVRDWGIEALSCASFYPSCDLFPLLSFRGNHEIMVAN